MVTLEQIQEARKAYDAICDEVSSFISQELSTCAEVTLISFAGDTWTHASPNEKKLFTKSCWVDLSESYSNLRIVSGYDYEGTAIEWHLPFAALEEGWIRAYDVKARAEAAQALMRRENEIIEKQKASKEKDKAKRRALYEKLREEFANEV